MILNVPLTDAQAENLRQALTEYGSGAYRKASHFHALLQAAEQDQRFATIDPKPGQTYSCLQGYREVLAVSDGIVFYRLHCQMTNTTKSYSKTMVSFIRTVKAGMAE